MKPVLKENSEGKPQRLSLVKAVSNWAGSVNPYNPDVLKRDGLEPIRIEESRLKGKAARMFVIAFVAFVGWSVLAPIDSGVNVTGTVVVMGNRKAVQHPSGGVVEELLVREGDVVKQGAPLIRLNRLSMESSLNTTELDYINVLAAESRLWSERQNLSEIKWLGGLDKVSDDPRVSEAKAQQTSLFVSRRAEILGQQRILEEQIAGLRTQVGEMHKVLVERKQQLNMMAEESKNYATLASEGFVPRFKANEIERSRSDLMASIANTTSEIGKTDSNIAATRLQLNQALAVFRREIDVQLAESQKNRSALKAKVDSLKFDLSLTELRAPVSGVVVGLKVNTVGGVIQGGNVLMEIVPTEGNLIVEAQVPPALIDKVHVGLAADMRFSAFNMVTTPVIPGTVKLVGADRLPGTGKDPSGDFYLAHIETTKEGYELLGRNQIQAGMPVDVVIKTGERTFMSYLAKPIADRFAKSFKEN
jgi:membrane fusion protein, protease secretion system